MIFVGDVAIAPGDMFAHRNFPPVFSKKYLCVNLEGAISRDAVPPKSGIYNSSEWHQAFDGFRLGPVCISNNHIADMKNGIRNTIDCLDAKQIAHFGTLESPVQAVRPLVFEEYTLLGFGWKVIGCIPAMRKMAGTNQLTRGNVISQVKETLTAYPSKKLVIVMHWNYEFELYPQPAHRRLAMELIDLGAHAVLGHHPHIVSPVEQYRGKTIAYSLGNWAFSDSKYCEGKLSFPVESFHQIAVELDRAGDVIHHATFILPSCIKYEKSELVGGDSSSLRPDFQGFDHDDYEQWFRLNRKKTKFLPIYQTADQNISNMFRDTWVFARQKVIGMALATGLKSPLSRG